MYIKIETEEAFSLSQLRQAHKNVSFPKSGASADWLTENGYAHLTVIPKPSVDEGLIAEKDGYEFVDSEWQTKWVIRAMTAQELQDDIDNGWLTVKNLQKQLLSSGTDTAWRMARYTSQDALQGKSPKENSSKMQDLLQYCQDVRDCDETNYPGDPEAAIDALNALSIPEE